MTLPSQFSLEEENFYKDIQDLVKKGSQNEKELSSFLQRYMDLLSRADLDDETFIINFTKAGFIIEASAKVYGTKVDRLWINLEHVLEALKNKNQGQSCKKKSDCDDDGGEEMDVDDEGKRKPSGRKRKKLGDAFFSADDFVEIDNITGLLGKNMNETSQNESSIKLCEKVPNMFIKNKRKKKRIDVCLNKCVEDKDVVRLRDWVISSEGLLMKEIYTPLPEDTISLANLLEREEMDDVGFDSEGFNDHENPVDNLEASLREENLKDAEAGDNLKDEKNNNSNVELILESSLKKSRIGDKLGTSDGGLIVEDLNISKESDLAKFPNLLNRQSGDCLVDVDEVFWNTSKFEDVIPSKRMRAGKTNKLACQLCCDKKVHKRKSKVCIANESLDSIDSYFTPHVQPVISEPHFGILPDEELYNIFKAEMKLIEQLGKVNSCKNINEAYHPSEKPEELKNFLGFDGFENYLMKRAPELQEEDEDEAPDDNLMLDPLEDNHENLAEDPLPEKDFELPFPVTESTLKTNFLRDDEARLKSNDNENNAEAEYQKLVMEELKDHYAAKTSFAKNKELGIKISKWHEMIADKIKLSQKRGALNMSVLAEKIMKAFPSDEKPTLPFRDLVKNQTQRDIPRYFFACLQLTNEGNLDIKKSDSRSLVTDCMIVTRLRETRTNYELEEGSGRSPAKRLNCLSPSSGQINRKRNSPSISESEDPPKKTKSKLNVVKSHKRPKKFNTANNSKRRKCSISSIDSIASE